MDNAVFETLLGVADSDGTVRTAAENKLKELAIQPEFPISLAKLTVSQQHAVPQRQLAAVTLKSYVTTHWSSKNDDKFVGPETPAEALPILNPKSELLVLMLYRKSHMMISQRTGPICSTSY
ncbi:hypothetical protein BDF20DRAFT_611502 [Mycotypha africana]|uniref:uncharacterized protein n=1 Tax=Mycotypha africana TaxID=64632 RepID=UPI002300BA4D|nr:uncharacterized protein BDF20DRAFT_611502 [Mycotypha africana]KAI8975507.1 hypothetical protein BDF20DRAFT_611502 [Mycotypha africana]